MLKHLNNGIAAVLFFFFAHFSVWALSDNHLLGARSAGIGNASVMLSDAWSVYHNQAGLGFMSKITAGIAYEGRFFIPEMGLKGAVIAVPLKKGGTFGLSVSSFGYSQYNENKAGVAYAMKFGENFSVGVQMNYLTTRIAENYGTSSALAAELGIQAKLNEQMTVGAHIFNLNRAKVTNYNNEKTPTIIRMGVSYLFSPKVFASAEAEKDIDKKPIAKAGVEYRVLDMLYLRAGISTNPFLNTFGIGVVKKGFKLDFATSIHSALGYSPQVSLGYQF